MFNLMHTTSLVVGVLSIYIQILFMFNQKFGITSENTPVAMAIT